MAHNKSNGCESRKNLLKRTTCIWKNRKIPIEFAELLPIANLSERVLLMLKLVKDLELSFQSTNPKLRRYFSRRNNNMQATVKSYGS